jgi:integrase
MQQGLAEDNPVLGTSKPGKELPRTRVLQPRELQAIWRATEHASDYHAIVRLLMLTGQRREEVAGMRWSEIERDARLWVLPPERTKNGLKHSVPLSDQAFGIIVGQPRRVDTSNSPRDLIFGRGSGPFSGWSRCKMRLDALLAKSAVAVPRADDSGLGNWRVHDLRRTMVTGMAEKLGILPHVIESVVNHISGHKSGVAGIYNLATYAEEKRFALQAWADYLDQLISTETVLKSEASGSLDR